MHARLCHSEAERGGGIFPTRACRARQNKPTTEPPRHRGKHKSFLYDSVSPSILPFRSRMSLCSFQGAFRRAVSNLFRTALAVGFGTRRRQIALEPSECFTACKKQFCNPACRFTIRRPISSLSQILYFYAKTTRSGTTAEDIAGQRPGRN